MKEKVVVEVLFVLNFLSLSLFLSLKKRPTFFFFF